MDNKEISFWQLITDTKISKIEIPIIQRDYAQGREDEKTKKVRGLFLGNLIKAIESESETLELDFVYGDINKNGVFQPLDGQQRLTTLFLLHWYLAYKTGNLSETNKDYFKKFTYETRISSREFCNGLVENVENENVEKLGDGNSIREKIEDASWFYLFWKNDPTIKAMLVMLDSIESRLKKSNEEPSTLCRLWGKLVSDTPPITFYFKQLNNIGLTDDLYIKMNARGKPLTDFENFKARFEKHIERKKWEENKVDRPTETFSHKIDTVWTDLFWKYRDAVNSIDNGFIKFIAGIAINSYAENQEIFESKDEDEITRKLLEDKKKKNITTEAVKRERIEQRITLLFNNPNEITPEDFPTETSFNYLIERFDIYAKKEFKNDEPIKLDLDLWDFLKTGLVKINAEKELEDNLFINLVKNDQAEYKQRVLFYAQTQFILNTEPFDPNSFVEWMRVVRNIVQNATIDSAVAYIGAIGLIKELSSGCTDIYDFLNTHSIESRFASDQVSEEILKSSIITKDEKNKEAIFLTEDTNFFKGKILFGLYCIGIGFENRNDEFNESELRSLCKVVSDHLSDNDISNEFRRALLTIDNTFYEYWTSFSYKLDMDKRCFIEDIADLKNNFTHEKGKYKESLRNLLVKLFKKSLDEIISECLDNSKCLDDMPNWKRRIIEEPELLYKFCKSHYFSIDGEKCYLYNNKKRPKSIKDCEEIS